MTDANDRVYRRLAAGIVLFGLFLALAWFLPEYGHWTEHADLDGAYHFGVGIGLALGLFMGPVVGSQLRELAQKHAK